MGSPIYFYFFCNFKILNPLSQNYAFLSKVGYDIGLFPSFFFNFLPFVEWKHGIFASLHRTMARTQPPYFHNRAEVRRSQVLFAMDAAATEWIIGLLEFKTPFQKDNLKFWKDRNPHSAIVRPVPF